MLKTINLNYKVSLVNRLFLFLKKSHPRIPNHYLNHKTEPRAIFDDNLLERKIFDTKVFDTKVVRCEKYSTKAYK